jgi:hypothetical protein
MSPSDFVAALKENSSFAVSSSNIHDASSSSPLSVLFEIADTQRSGELSFTDFVLFHDLTCKPLAEYEMVSEYNEYD